MTTSDYRAKCWHCGYLVIPNPVIVSGLDPSLQTPVSDDSGGVDYHDDLMVDKRSKRDPMWDAGQMLNPAWLTPFRSEPGWVKYYSDLIIDKGPQIDTMWDVDNKNLDKSYTNQPGTQSNIGTCPNCGARLSWPIK